MPEEKEQSSSLAGFVSLFLESGGWHELDPETSVAVVPGGYLVRHTPTETVEAEVDEDDEEEEGEVEEVVVATAITFVPLPSLTVASGAAAGIADALPGLIDMLGKKG